MEISPFKTQEVQEDNNQEKAQSERNSHSKYRDVHLQKAALKTLPPTNCITH